MKRGYTRWRRSNSREDRACIESVSEMQLHFKHTVSHICAADRSAKELFDASAHSEAEDSGPTRTKPSIMLFSRYRDGNGQVSKALPLGTRSRLCDVSVNARFLVRSKHRGNINMATIQCHGPFIIARIESCFVQNYSWTALRHVLLNNLSQGRTVTQVNFALALAFMSFMPSLASIARP